MNLFSVSFDTEASGLSHLLSHLSAMDDSQRMDALNEVRKALHEISPMRHEPVDLVLWVPCDTVEANDYNPNSVAPPEMKLLELSIMEDGYTQPVVTYAKTDKREVVDGFHRNRVGKESEKVKSRVMGRLPVVTINEGRQAKGDRMAATIRHNRARGKHRVEAMSEIVMDLRKRKWSDEKIAKQLGMDPDEVLRLTQVTGLAEAFKDREFSEAWDAVYNNADEVPERIQNP